MARSPISLGLVLLALLAAPPFLSGSAKVGRKSAAKAQKQPEEPPRPPLPQELPPVPPKVTYQGGLLTIVAQNSTLLDILTEVHKATGAAVDAPAGLAGERVATRLGPGSPRDVLTELLNGSRFDYILLSALEDPGGVRSLILRARAAEGSVATGGAAPGSAAVSIPAARPTPARTLPPDTSEDENAAPEPSVEPAEEVPPEPQPQMAPPQPPEVKSPEQIQEDLRHQQEELQRQQQQQQQQQPPQDQPPQ